MLRPMTHPVPNLGATLDRIRAWAAANELKPATLAKLAGIAEGVTRDLADPGWAPTSKSIRALEALIPRDWRVGDPLPKPKRKAA